jgi:hypothetical protein
MQGLRDPDGGATVQWLVIHRPLIWNDALATGLVLRVQAEVNSVGLNACLQSTEMRTSCVDSARQTRYLFEDTGG